MQLSSKFKALLRGCSQSSAASLRAAAPTAASQVAISTSSGKAFSSQEGKSEEGQAPLPDFNYGPRGDRDPLSEVTAPGPRIGKTAPSSDSSGQQQQQEDTRSGEAGGLGSHRPQSEGIENPTEGPGDYSQPQIRSETYARGGNNNDLGPRQRQQLVDDASEEGGGAGGRWGGERGEAAGGDARSEEERVTDRAAVETAGPAGRLVHPKQVRSQGPDLPPGHDATGSTLKSTVDQSDA
ncbi:hypothetical protein Agub_g5372 [Astrephomene gubernaculifera]|uniref:Uncharacterized protein n=1 Tax=Astrephomene gubernaculifera TaxID=47775 RepID=A0AAD3DLR8_9CHLO|nr:hypothetical protein Agub_g5372 [Astrephomene gubernaculifera]